MKPARYDGKTCWKTYLNHFEVCVQHNEWDDNENIAHLRWDVTGQTVQLLWHTEGFTYIKLIKKLAHRFGSGRFHKKFNINSVVGREQDMSHDQDGRKTFKD